MHDRLTDGSSDPFSYVSFLETYQEYKKVKSRLSGSRDKAANRGQSENGVEGQGSSPPAHTEEDGVFGSSLNKKPRKKANGDFCVRGRGEGEGERKSVWKLRKWSKIRGHHTVVVKEEESKGHAGEEKSKEKDGAGIQNEDRNSEVHNIHYVYNVCDN